MDYKKIHAFSLRNREKLEKSDLCGCFYCLKIFTPSKIADWIQEKGGDTAICPYCGTDAILPEHLAKYALTKELLHEMNCIFF